MDSDRTQIASARATAGWLAWLCASFMALVLWNSCATQKSEPASNRPGSGIDEYDQLAARSQSALKETIVWLDRLDSISGNCSPKLVAEFSQEVDELQIESMTVRARAQAIQARGVAYLESWSSMSGPPEDMRHSFETVMKASQATGDAFRQFLALTRKLRVQLEMDPGALAREDNRTILRSARGSGLGVVERLGEIRNELKTLKQLVVAKGPQKPQPHP